MTKKTVTVGSPDTYGEPERPARPLQLSRRAAVAPAHVINRALPDSGVARLDVAVFTRSL